MERITILVINFSLKFFKTHVEMNRIQDTLGYFVRSAAVFCDKCTEVDLKKTEIICCRNQFQIMSKAYPSLMLIFYDISKN